MKNLLYQEKPLYAFTFLSSMVISMVTYWQRGIINKDGILYIEIAKNYVENGLYAAYTTFNWPIYGILIGLTNKLTGITYETSAHVLNGLLVAVLCTSFVAVYRATEQPGTRPSFAAILILGLPILNDYRELIIRDFGFWTFSLVALLYFIRFSRLHSVGAATAWQSAAIAATAFRIEGIVFFVAPTLFYLFRQTTAAEKVSLILRSSYLLIGLGAVGAAAMLYAVLSESNRAGTLLLWLGYLSPARIIAGIQAESVELHEQLEYLSSSGEALLILCTGLFSLAIVKLATNAVIPYLLVTAYGAKKRWLGFGQGNRITLLFFSLAFLTLLAILANRYFLSSRYTVTAVLFLSLLTIPYVDVLFQKLAGLPNRYWHLAGWTIVLVIFLDGVISTPSPKAIIKSGAQWAIGNLDPSPPCLSNEVRLQFYTEGKCKYLPPEQFTEDLPLVSAGTGAGYLLMWLPRKDQATTESLKNAPDLQLLRHWENRKGDQVVIYTTSSIPRPARE